MKDNVEIKDKILALKDGEVCDWPLGEESGAEIWLKNEQYFLFEIPLYGGQPRYSGVCSCKHSVDRLIEEVRSWT